MINWWSIHYDPIRYPNPHKFDPSRFLNHPLGVAEEANHPDPYQRSHVGFGGGRRICPGMHVADRSMFINIARTLWGFDVRLRRDEGGEVPIDFGLTGTMEGSNCTPKPFECGMKPLSVDLSVYGLPSLWTSRFYKNGGDSRHHPTKSETRKNSKGRMGPGTERRNPY
jgi:Cytochrome P450